MAWVELATDDFNRANQDLAVPPWTGGTIPTGCKILNNVATGKAAPNIGLSWYTNIPFGDIQYAEADLVSAGAVAAYSGVSLRGPGGTQRCYLFLWQFNIAQLIIIRIVNGATSNPQSGPAGWAHPTGVNGRIRAEANGTLLSLYWNGVLVGTATDNLYASGSPGIVDSTQSDLWAVDNFAAGEWVDMGRRNRRHRGGELWGIIPEVANYLG
jgi:hypothetical protein